MRHADPPGILSRPNSRPAARRPTPGAGPRPPFRAHRCERKALLLPHVALAYAMADTFRMAGILPSPGGTPTSHPRATPRTPTGHPLVAKLCGRS